MHRPTKIGPHVFAHASPVHLEVIGRSRDDVPRWPYLDRGLKGRQGRDHAGLPCGTSHPSLSASCLGGRFARRAARRAGTENRRHTLRKQRQCPCARPAPSLGANVTGCRPCGTGIESCAPAERSFPRRRASQAATRRPPAPATRAAAVGARPGARPRRV